MCYVRIAVSLGCDPIACVTYAWRCRWVVIPLRVLQLQCYVRIGCLVTCVVTTKKRDVSSVTNEVRKLTQTYDTVSVQGMDEVSIASLADGTLVTNMRNDHANPCDCRAFSSSVDGGVTWSAIGYDAVRGLFKGPLFAHPAHLVVYVVPKSTHQQPSVAYCTSAPIWRPLAPPASHSQGLATDRPSTGSRVSRVPSVYMIGQGYVSCIAVKQSRQSRPGRVLCAGADITRV